MGIFAVGEISLLDATVHICIDFVARFRSTKILYHTFFEKAIPFIKIFLILSVLSDIEPDVLTKLGQSDIMLNVIDFTLKHDRKGFA